MTVGCEFHRITLLRRRSPWCIMLVCLAEMPMELTTRWHCASLSCPRMPIRLWKPGESDRPDLWVSGVQTKNYHNNNNNNFERSKVKLEMPTLESSSSLFVYISHPTVAPRPAFPSCVSVVRTIKPTTHPTLGLHGPPDYPLGRPNIMSIKPT